MECGCGANTHLGYPSDDPVDGDKPDEYCCHDAYEYYNSPPEWASVHMTQKSTILFTLVTVHPHVVINIERIFDMSE